MKDAVAYLLFNYFTVGPTIFCQVIGIPVGSDPAPFLPTSSYIFMKVYKLTNEEWPGVKIAARCRWKLFRFIKESKLTQYYSDNTVTNLTRV